MEAQECLDSINNQWGPAWCDVPDTYPGYVPEGPEHLDEQGNRYQRFVDVGTGWRGLLVRTAAGKIEPPWWKG